LWTARNGNADVMKVLIEAGASILGQPYVRSVGAPHART
jgi:hypothetical protein